MSKTNMELRFDTGTKISSNDDGSMVVEGYVNMTEQPSNMLGKKTKFVEKISKGAWTRAINRAKEIHFYAEHDKEKILASTRNGSLELREDENGLYMKATISPTSWGKDYYQLISDGILQNMSFGFRSIQDKWKNLGTHFERTVNDLDLFEVSVVRDPAYSASSIAARGIDLVEEEVPEDIVTTNISIDIRSESEDLEKIAQAIFEKFKSHFTEKENDDTEVVVEETVEEDPITTEETTIEETKDKQDTEDTENVEVTTEDEEVVEDTQETPNEENTTEETLEDKPAENIREFINKFK